MKSVGELFRLFDNLFIKEIETLLIRYIFFIVKNATLTESKVKRLYFIFIFININPKILKIFFKAWT